VSIQAAYTDWSATYDTDRNLTRDLDQIVTRKILGHLHYRSILEMGCGTGKNTGFLATIGEQVLALDFSLGMIQKAKEKDPSDRIQYVVANLTELWPCKDHTVDLIICNLVLEHIQDLPSIFAQTSRTLVGGGQFFICELHPFRQYQGTVANFERAEQKIEIQAFTHHLSDFFNAARQNSFTLKDFNEWWHEQDEHKPPRLVSMLFEK
jgi:ubiquinone/menaquinone biosynthesis C-methylase UbiE